MSQSSNQSRIRKDYGNKCEICGYNKFTRALQFHHVDRKSKRKSVAEISNYKSKKEEAKKCVLVCSNCHIAIEANQLKIPNHLLERVEFYKKTKEIKFNIINSTFFLPIPQIEFMITKGREMKQRQLECNKKCQEIEVWKL